MDYPSMKKMYGILLLILFLSQVQGEPSFSDIPLLFSQATIVVGTNTSDRMASSLVLNAFVSQGLKIEEENKDEGNLLLIGGPRANELSEKYSRIFGIKILEEKDTVTITAEGKGITHKKSEIGEDIAIAYIREYEGRNILLLWGYGRKGTYAACLYFSKKENWQDKHLLFILWEDKNEDGIVSLGEVLTGEKKKEEKEDLINVTLIIDYGGDRQQMIETKIKRGATVLDLLRQEAQVDYTIYPFGVFVTSINGLANDNTRGYYWLYWVNGVYANVSADAFFLQEGDVVEWRYRKP